MPLLMVTYLQADTDAKKVGPSPFILLRTSNTWVLSQLFQSSVTFNSGIMTIRGVNYTWPNSATDGNCLQYNAGALSWATCGSGGGGGASSLAIATGSAQAANIITTPTAVINFDSATIAVQLTGGATAYVSLKDIVALLNSTQTWTANQVYNSSATFLASSSFTNIVYISSALMLVDTRADSTRPALYFNNENRSGFYRKGTNIIALSFDGVDVWSSADGNFTGIATIAGKTGTAGNLSLRIGSTAGSPGWYSNVGNDLITQINDGSVTNFSYLYTLAGSGRSSYGGVPPQASLHVSTDLLPNDRIFLVSSDTLKFEITGTSSTFSNHLVSQSSFSVTQGTTSFNGQPYLWPSTGAPAATDLTLHYKDGALYFGGDGGGGGSGDFNSFQNPSTGPLNMGGFGISNSTGIDVGQGVNVTSFMSTTSIHIATNSPTSIGDAGIVRASTGVNNGPSFVQWDTPAPREFSWNGAALLAVSTPNSPNIPPVVQTTGTLTSVVMGASFDDTAEECRGSSFRIPRYANRFSSPTFTATWFSSSKSGATGNVVWDIKYSSAIMDSNSWDVRRTTVTAGVSAATAGANKVAEVSWQPGGVGSGARAGHGTLSSMAWDPGELVFFNVCREGANAADSLVGDAVLLDFTISIPLR